MSEAQLPDVDDPAALAALVEEVEATDRDLVLVSFTAEDALDVGLRLLALARERALPVTVAVTRGHQLALAAALPGSVPDQEHWIARKRAVVARWDASSYLVGLRARAGGTAFADAPGLDHLAYAAHGGCVPVRVAGVGAVGTVAVSGLHEHLDHALAVEVLTAHRDR